MRSIIQHFNDNRDFPRLRIGMRPLTLSLICIFFFFFVHSLKKSFFQGIGRPPGKMEAASFVLRPFTKQERQEVCKTDFQNYGR